MNIQLVAFGPPADLGAWILLSYTLAVVAGAWVLRQIGHAHFRRAQLFAETGFEYDSEFDHYECPEGERLPLHVIDPGGRVAVYRATASSCATCPRKAECTPHDQGRHVYRPLAAWAETDCGQFHRWVAVVMNGSAAMVGVVAASLFAGRPGVGLLLTAAMLAVASLVIGLRAAGSDQRVCRAGRDDAGSL